MILVDTNILIHQPPFLADDGQAFAASILSRAELEFGLGVVAGEQARRRRRRLLELDELFDWLPFTVATTKAYGVLAKVMRAGAPAQVRRIDTYIAAHALEWAIPLLTANPHDFARISDLIEIRAYPEIKA